MSNILWSIGDMLLICFVLFVDYYQVKICVGEWQNEI